VGTLAPGAFAPGGGQAVNRGRRDVVRPEQRRILAQPPVETRSCFRAKAKEGISRNSDHARKSLRLFDEEHRTKEDVRLDRQLRRRPFQLDTNDIALPRGSRSQSILLSLPSNRE